MAGLIRYPLLVFAVTFVGLSVSVCAGKLLSKRRTLESGVREDLSIIQTVALTLLGLIVGFTFSMALNRYDQRMGYEQAEANAIGTEYLRADLLPAAAASRVRSLLHQYLDERVLFYSTRDEGVLRRCNADTSKLQSELWLAVRAPAVAMPTPTVALAVTGMNEVLDAQGRTQAAWQNPIPFGAWALMVTMALATSTLAGFGAKTARIMSPLILFLPFLASIAFFLIADIDSPRWGLIRVVPENLLSLSQSLHP